jgi:hypothetical protein
LENQVTGRDQSNPLFDLTLTVACWRSAQRLDKTRDQINAAIAEALAHLARDEADDILHRAARMVRRQIEARQGELIEKRIAKRQCRKIRKPARLEQHGDVRAAAARRFRAITQMIVRRDEVVEEIITGTASSDVVRGRRDAVQ